MLTSPQYARVYIVRSRSLSRGSDAKSSTVDRYSASPAISYHPNHPSTLSSPQDFYENGHNYGDDAHSSPRIYWDESPPYPGSSNPPLLFPTNKIDISQEWLRQTPPGHLFGPSYTTHHLAPGDVDSSSLTYNLADSSPVFPGLTTQPGRGNITGIAYTSPTGIPRPH